MQITAATLLALHCALGLAIRVPTVWDQSEVNPDPFAVDNFAPQIVASTNQKPIPAEYFQYAAPKPKFAVDIAKFHGVQAPENHYKAYPVKPHTGVPKPELGKHQMLNENRNIFRPYQEYVKKNEAIRTVTPSTTSYEVFHPYKLEEPALKELYQDPVMDKIRNDLLNSKNRLQKYENEAGEPDITKDEYLETPEETDRKKVSHRNVPAPYEIHKAHRRPVYYLPPSIHNNREHVLNQKLRHPWHQNYIKVKPIHYRPVKNHLQRLRQQHALKYDDERNEYPQLPIPEKNSEPPDGYDIYEKGKAKFVQLRNNVDESINNAVQKNTQAEDQKTELNDDESDEDTDSERDEGEFVPIKNYAQVRKTETTKHLPKEAAYDDAETLDEILNAPRLREAIKSSKAQTVYSEEGYEDAAYDHAGEQKHASDHEAHGGFLKEKELSEGKFKIPTFSAKFDEEDGSEVRDQVLDGKKWKDDKKNTENETELEDFSEDEQNHSDERDSYKHSPKDNVNDSDNEAEVDNSQSEESDRAKREHLSAENKIEAQSGKAKRQNEHDVNKREAVVEIPKLQVDSIDFTNEEISKSIKSKPLPQTVNINYKYPYYSTKSKIISKDSPLRYAENLKLIPKKSKGGTEFYDSRSKLECPEVDDNVDPIPEKIKKGGHPDDNDDAEDDDTEIETQKDKSDFSTLEQKPRLKGLGDKIDCFKAKYFGENPLDSPFFKEEIISNPEPVTIPSIDIYKLKKIKQQFGKEQNQKAKQDLFKELSQNTEIDMFTLIDKLYPKQLIEVPKLQRKLSNDTSVSIKSQSLGNHPIIHNPGMKLQVHNVKESPIKLRKRRATPFVYEPYKIIRDGQVQDSKKTTTTNNISPLIKQLQSSRVVDKVTPNSDKEQVVKRNAGTSGYKNIGKSDREKFTIKEKGTQPEYDASFVDVSIDQRRGEPRYELRPINHKSQYTPIEETMSMETEGLKVNKNKNTNSDVSNNNKKAEERKRRKVTTSRPHFDVSKFLPQSDEEKNDASSDKIEMIIRPQFQPDKTSDNDDSLDEYDDDDDDDGNQEIQHTTPASTTKLPPRRRILRTSTTIRPENEVHSPSTDKPKLRLRTRFRDSYQTETPVEPNHDESIQKKQNNEGSKSAPKYRVKKKKSTERTLVTDTKSYGEDDDDLGKEEVDALIGVKQNDAEYLPTYEKHTGDSRSNGPADNDDDDHSYEEDEDEDDDDDDDDNDDDDEEEIDEEDEEDEEVDNEPTSRPELTTPEPTKRTLIRTTEAPSPTTEARSAKLELKPIVSKKKFEIHKELPVNKLSPHITEFKQDIKEEEIIKEMPSKMKQKPQKHIEALELYRDENLAKDVNKLGGVEIFKEGLDLVNGPKHGGNYRIAGELTSDTSLPGTKNQKPSKGDVVGSQSKTSKLVELKDNSYSRRRGDIQRARNSRGRNAKFIELSDSTERPPLRPMHGGNFKSIHDVRRRGGNRNAKIIELDDHHSRDDHSSNTNGRDFKSYGSRGGDRHQMHGGNYRSAKLVQADDTKDKVTESETVTKKNTFLDNIRDEPVFDTLPSYILDPSKRMYYYVDA